MEKFHEITARELHQQCVAVIAGTEMHSRVQDESREFAFGTVADSPIGYDIAGGPRSASEIARSLNR
jgi:hypothetical protein